MNSFMLIGGLNQSKKKKSINLKTGQSKIIKALSKTQHMLKNCNLLFNFSGLASKGVKYVLPKGRKIWTEGMFEEHYSKTSRG